MNDLIFDVKGISFCYSHKEVIKDLSLQIEKGKFYALVGPNGSGKTTLLDLLLGVKRPTTGEICFYGKNLMSFTKKEISRKIALVPQLFRTNIPYTVEEIIIMGRYPYMGRLPLPSKEDKDIVEKVMRELKIEGMRSRYITNLSGGERQLVIFARALAQDTPVLFLDEVTSHLDIKHSLIILEMVKKRVLKKGVTVLSVFHDLNMVLGYADELIFIKEGMLISKGSIKKVLKEDIVEHVFDIRCKILNLNNKTKYIIFNLKKD